MAFGRVHPCPSPLMGLRDAQVVSLLYLVHVVQAAYVQAGCEAGSG